jgi:uncharacterized protein YifE (UPF0438 family)
MNNEMTQNERKRWARVLYVHNSKDISETATEVNVPESTIKQWIHEGAWDTFKRSLLISKSAQLERLYGCIEELDAKRKTNDFTMKDADLITKYTAAIKNLDTDNSVYSIIEAAELFITWMYSRNIPMAQSFVRQFQLFIRERKAA